MKLTKNYYTFLSAAIGGFLIWYFAESVFGHKEPWDGNLLAYLPAIAIIGFASTYIFKGDPRWAYWGGYVGQLVFAGVPFLGCIFFGYFCTIDANFLPAGAIFLLVYSLPILLGALLGSRI